MSDLYTCQIDNKDDVTILPIRIYSRCVSHEAGTLFGTNSLPVTFSEKVNEGISTSCHLSK